MRSSLSCELCRKSKVKCVNSGISPCAKCERLSRSGCELTRPRAPSAKRASKRSRRVVSTGSPSPIPPAVSERPSASQLPDAPQDRPSNLTPCLVTSPPIEACGKNNLDQYLATLPTGIILKALNVFTSKFPELRILQPSLFMAEYQSSRSMESKALLATILAATKKQPSVRNDCWAKDLPDQEMLASYARGILSDCILQPPKLIVVQVLLILTLYEWGVRDFHKAWMHCGIAIRMMQSLHSSRVTPFPLDISHGSDLDEFSAAAETRTYWACFIMDCTINSGTYNPRMLLMSEMETLKVPRPLTSVEFAFGSDTATHPTAQGQQSIPTGNCPPVTLDIAHHFEIIASGFDIYAQVMAFVFNDGRRAPGMCAPENCPWVPTSPWAVCQSRLANWRAGQHSRLHYPKHSVAVYMTLGFGESFIYLNLVYYLSVMMLHREYLPFLPTPELTPRGPIDHPLLEAEAPAGWWDDSALQMFGSAELIIGLLSEASECGIPVMTPFSGFCAFSACFVNLYIYRFPRMNLNRSPRAKELMEKGLEYLREFQHAWDLGTGWIKTIQNSSLLYERATSDSRPYKGKSRFDFETLHQSVHEFRIIDRSDQHIQQIHRAEQDATSQANTLTREVANLDGNSQDSSSQPLMDLGNAVDDQGLWPNWWSMLEEADFSGAFMAS
ncbi:putative transcriptional regulatory protein PB1A11.04c [Ilyonectria robusta]